MKTKEQIKNHLKSFGYKKDAITKIMGFLVGAGIKALDEKFLVSYGEFTFEEFVEWFNAEDNCCCCDDCILCSIINDISTRLENAEDDEMKTYYANQLSFIIEAFDLSDEELQVL